MGGYRAINEYGLIGDCRTAALVGPDGSIDWFCWPRFDSDAVFGRVAPVDASGDGAMRYRPQTAVLETVHRTADAAVCVVDAAAAPEFARGHTRILRLVEGQAGEVELESVMDPKPAFGQADVCTLTSDHVTELAADGFFARLGVVGDGIRSEQDGTAIRHRFTVRAGERVALMLVCGEGVQPAADVADTIDDCERWWRQWCADFAYRGEYREAVLRSAITLKLLSHAPTGAIVAAPTASLPEDIGGVRNWDYRYTWLRDASLTVDALLSSGQHDVAQPFMQWVCDRVGELDDVEGLRIMYAVDGSSELGERVLEHFEGYRRSRPVRIGNAAIDQLQLDVYGEVLNCLAVCEAHGLDITDRVWLDFRRVVDWVADNWSRPDNGIWEVRSDRRHFVFSKVMAWVALDRGAAIGERAGDNDAGRWRREADKLHAEVLERGWSERLGAFKQSYEDDVLDAANLQIPLVGFLPPDDARVHATIDATLRDLTSDGLVFRYRGTDDGLPGDEGTFTMVTFWLISALALCGRSHEARRLFEQVLRFGGPLGLFAEEIAADTGVALGNYPQAFTHIGLIGAALDLQGARGGLARAP
jgi:GH15 family glucan-1,4-alpha-glucosidase